MEIFFLAIFYISLTSKDVDIYGPMTLEECQELKPQVEEKVKELKYPFLAKGERIEVECVEHEKVD